MPRVANERMVFECFIDDFPMCCGLRVMADFQLHMLAGHDKLLPEDWDAIRKAICEPLAYENKVMLAVTVVAFNGMWDYATADSHTKMLYDLYRFIDSMGEVIRTFRNPVHNSTLNLVLFNPQKMGLSTYDF
jgi:hypothetical protein